MCPMAAWDREQQYRFLASLYLRPPSESLVGMIRDGSMLSVFTGVSTGEDPGDGAPGEMEPETPLAHLREFIQQAQVFPNLEGELEAEHTALFVLPSGVIPHEAVYLDREKRLGGRVTIAVGQFYEKAGIRLLESCREMPDHLGLELEFMAALCRLEGDLEGARNPAALRECVVLQETFLEEHLSRWAFECCQNVVRQARSGFYKALAQFTTEFLRGEQVCLSQRHAQVCREEASLCEPVQST
jgi:TorA maturation chaperone TorD